MKLKHDESTIQNLELTNLKITDHIEPLPKLFYTKWIEKITNLYTIKTWQSLSILMTWILLISYIIKTSHKRPHIIAHNEIFYWLSYMI